MAKTPDTQPQPETSLTLKQAIHEVTGLYLGDQLSGLLGNQRPEQRDEFWKETAREFPSLQGNIEALRDALTSAKVTKEAYPQPMPQVMRMHFGKVQDQSARELLTDLLWARTMSSPGYMDYSVEPVKEALKIAEELGVSDGLRGEQIQKIDLDQTVEAVLTGKLRVSR